MYVHSPNPHKCYVSTCMYGMHNIVLNISILSWHYKHTVNAIYGHVYLGSCGTAQRQNHEAQSLLTC